MRVLLVAVDAAARAPIEQGAELAGDVEILAVDDAGRAVAAAASDDPPAAVVISTAVPEPVKLAQSLSSRDAEMSITILAAPDDVEAVRGTLRFAPMITPHTGCRSTGDLEQLGVDLVEAAQGAVRRREHRASLAAATARLAEPPARLKLRGEALGRLVEAAPIGIMTLSGAHDVVAWNAHAAEIVGAPEGEVLGRPVAALFDARDSVRLEQMLRSAMPSGHAARPVLLRRRRHGQEQFVEVSASPTVSGAGDPEVLLVLGDVTERELASRARRRAEAAQAFLAETGALLDASLDPVETLQRIASLAVPARAELCLIDLLEEEGTIRAVAFAAVDPEVARAVQDIRDRYPVDPAGSHPVARVLRSGEAEVLEEMTDETYLRIAQSDEHVELMRRLHYHSALVAPLAARGRTYGAISLLYLDPERMYSPDDLSILEDVARRAALALDNARLYARERRIAETLQRSLLPPRLPEVAGVSLAARYEPGEGDVGGDWYDVIPLPDGRVACVVGDIVGRGIPAASVMGQLRNAVRVYALERDTAGEVVDAVDRLSNSLGIDQMATMAYLVLDPAQNTIEVCCAGHPPPLLVEPGGAARYLTEGRSAPVGVGLRQAHTAAREDFPPGSLLVLYTDGLIERRGTPIDDGLDRLKAVVTEAIGLELGALADLVVDRLRPGASADDVALLALRADLVPERLRLSLPADFGGVRTVRSELRRWLAGRLAPEELYDVLLACSEACANAVEHAYALRKGEVVVEGDLAGDELRVVIRDFGRWRRPGSSGRGRGTGIMEATMDEVQVTTDEQGTEVVLRRRLDARASA